jgi:hypothetical protein
MAQGCAKQAMIGSIRFDQRWGLILIALDEQVKSCLALPVYAEALRSFVLACPCFGWDWTVEAREGRDEASTLGEDVGHWYVGKPDTQFEIVDIAAVDDDARLFWFLNDFGKNANAQFLDYHSSLAARRFCPTVKQECLTEVTLGHNLGSGRRNQAVRF